jgi:hypothetical protein
LAVRVDISSPVQLLARLGAVKTGDRRRWPKALEIVYAIRDIDSIGNTIVVHVAGSVRTRFRTTRKNLERHGNQIGRRIGVVGTQRYLTRIIGIADKPGVESDYGNDGITGGDSVGGGPDEKPGIKDIQRLVGRMASRRSSGSDISIPVVAGEVKLGSKQPHNEAGISPISYI